MSICSKDVESWLWFYAFESNKKKKKRTSVLVEILDNGDL